tara:strand:+ start:199 stop:804 length:606 start_codon:yes stop_codon:yes gene_type:complete
MFGGDIPLSAVTAAHAEEFREHLLSNGKRDGVGLARATVNKHCSIANQYFKAAYKRRVITENPFEGIECRNLPNRERMAFVEPQQITQLLEHLPMWQDRVTLGLARYGGLRCPSEVLALKWEHIHLGDNTKNDPSYMMVRNEKTMHHRQSKHGSPENQSKTHTLRQSVYRSFKVPGRKSPDHQNHIHRIILKHCLIFMLQN